MADACDIETIFCWKLHAPWIWFQEMQGIFKYGSSNPSPCTWRRLANSSAEVPSNMASFTTDFIKCNLISNLAFNISYTSSFPYIKLCHDLLYYQLVFFFYLLQSLLFCFEIKHCLLESMTITKQKSKNLWIFYHKWHRCPSANKSNCVVWVELRNI